MNKKLKNVCLGSIDEGSAEYVIKQLSNLEEVYPGHTNFTFRYDYWYSDDSKYLVIYGDRLETDKEYEDRIAYEKLFEKSLRESELKTLKFLREKYPGEFK